jgi:hypothetical protein
MNESNADANVDAKLPFLPDPDIDLELLQFLAKAQCTAYRYVLTKKGVFNLKRLLHERTTQAKLEQYGLPSFSAQELMKLIQARRLADKFAQTSE